MAVYNQNYKAVNLVSGNTYTTGQLGDGLSGSCVHEIFCLASGSITVVALGGGSFTWNATTSDFFDIMVGSCTVTSGSFVGFKSQNAPSQNLPSSFYNYTP